jgi:hypothetical protein
MAVMRCMLKLTNLTISLCEKLTRDSLAAINDWGEGMTSLEMLVPCPPPHPLLFLLPLMAMPGANNMYYFSSHAPAFIISARKTIARAPQWCLRVLTDPCESNEVNAPLSAVVS